MRTRWSASAKRAPVLPLFAHPACTEKIHRHRSHHRIRRIQLFGNAFRPGYHLDEFAHAVGGDPSHLGVDVTQCGEQRVGIAIGKMLDEGGHRGASHPWVGVVQEL